MNTFARAVSFILWIALLGGKITPPAAAAQLNPSNILVSDFWDRTVTEYTVSGRAVQTFRIDTPPTGAENLRDIVVGPTGAIHMFDGTFLPYMTTLNPVNGGQTRTRGKGFDTVNVLGLGGIAAYGRHVFVTDMAIGGSETGLLRFDTIAGTSVRFANGLEFADVTMGRDGLLYAIVADTSPAWAVNVYHPRTLERVRTVALAQELQRAAIKGLVADARGRMYGAAWDGKIYAINPDGSVAASLNTGLIQLLDLDIDASGRLLAGSRFGDVILTDTSLASFTSFRIGEPPIGPTISVAFASPAPVPEWRLAWQNTQTGDVSYWRMNDNSLAGSGFLARGVPLEWRLFGHLGQSGSNGGLLWYSGRSGDVTRWSLNGLTYSNWSHLYSNVPIPWLPAPARLDSAATGMLFWRNQQTGDLSYWQTDGGRVVAAGLVWSNVPLAWQIEAALDLDGNGSSDLVWRHQQTGDVSYWLMDGARVVSMGVLYSGVPRVWRIGAGVDIDGDGDDDLIWQNTQTGDVSYWRLQNLAIAETGPLFQRVPPEWQLRTAF